MRILYVLNSGNIGGMEQHTLDLVEGMRNRGHQIFVWCNQGPLFDMFEKLGVTTVVKAIRFDVDPFYIFSLVSFLEVNKIEVLHAHELKASVNSLIAGFIAGVSVRVTHTHTPISEWEINNLKKRINIYIYSFLVNRFSSREIALTESRKFAKQTEGIHEGKLKVIPNGLDPEKFAVSEAQKKDYKFQMAEKYNLPCESFVFGNISRLTKEKGHKVLLEAFSLFLKSSREKKVDVSDVFLVVAGGGELESALKEKATSLDIIDAVFFVGRFEDEDLVKLYSSFDAFLFPTLAEGFGLVLIEAMASGISVICSDLDVLKEVGGSTVMYFETGNTSALSEKMYDLYMRFDRFSELRESAQQRVKELYTREKFLDNYEGLYKTLLNI